MKTLKEYLKLPYRMEIVPDDEGGFVATYPDLPGCISVGRSIVEATSNLEDAKKVWLESALEDGIKVAEPNNLDEYSGQFKLRMPKSLHRSLALHAKQEGTSMNQYCLYLLTMFDSSTNARI